MPIRRSHCICALVVALISAASVRVGVADETPRRVTFARDVAPIFQKHCQSCHRPGEIGPFSLLTYEEARPWAKAIRTAVERREMPPWGAEGGTGNWLDDASLAPQQIQTIVDWVEQGAPRGNLADLPDPVVFPNDKWQLGKPDVALYPTAPFTVSGDTEDTYRCYVLDPEINDDAWIVGVEYDVDNASIAHHILAYADEDRRYRDKDAEDDGPGFECSMETVTHLGTKNYIGGWTPGGRPLQLPEGVGVRLRDDADVILQIHYHNTSGESQTDQTGIGLHFARNPIQKKARGSIVGAPPSLTIPAGEANWESRGQIRLPADISVFAIRPHMHYLGKDMKITAVDPDGRERTLISVPHYNFDWQFTYMARQPIRLKKGTTVKMVAHHDNSAGNPDNPHDPPVEVHWGERSDDEMCHAWLFYTADDEKLNKEPDPMWKVLGIRRVGEQWLDSWFEE